MTEEKMYQISEVSCGNCGYCQGPFNIPKGETWWDYLRRIDYKCEDCGCGGGNFNKN